MRNDHWNEYSRITYTLFEKSLNDDRIHGLVLVHLSDLGSDYISRKALDWKLWVSQGMGLSINS